MAAAADRRPRAGVANVVAVAIVVAASISAVAAVATVVVAAIAAAAVVTAGGEYREGRGGGWQRQRPGQPPLTPP